MIGLMLRRFRRFLRPAQLCVGFALCVLAGPTSAGPLGLPGPQPAPILNNTTDRVGDTLGRVGDAVDTTTGKVGGVVGGVTGTVGDTLGTATDTVGGTLQTVTGAVGNTLNGVTGAVGDTLDQTLSGVKRDLAGRPFVPNALEKDAQGQRVVAGRVLALSPSDRALSAARSLNFEIVSDEQLSPLGLKLVVLRSPLGMNAIDAVSALRAVDPQGSYDFAHIYDPSGETVAAPGGGLPNVVAANEAKIGIIDAGIDKSHPAFRDADITTKATVKNGAHALPTAHGTAVASLLVGDDGQFRGVLPGAELYAADAFGGSATGGAADDIVRALAWLAEKNVPVINISITGPKNALLEAAIRAAIAHGHIIVAAAGNDGPAAPVKYPAAYDGVVAVTSVDAKHKVQLDANRGPQIAFAARGVDVRVAQPGAKYGAVTGTSFASPLVAGRFAELMPNVDVVAAEHARRALKAEAISPTGSRDAVYGFGILELRSTSAAATAAK